MFVCLLKMKVERVSRNRKDPGKENIFYVYFFGKNWKNDYFRVRLSVAEILNVSGLEFWKEFEGKQNELRKSHSISAVRSPGTYNTVVYLGRQDVGRVQGIPRK